MNYHVSDFVIRLKNATGAKRKKVVAPYSRLVKDIASVLVKEGFLESVKESVIDEKKVLEVTIRYQRRSSVLTGVSIFSKPSLRIYTNKGNISKLENKGRNTLVLSTNKGVMTGKEAQKKGVGGEILFEVW